MTQISVNCILDSVNPFGNRLTTFELTIPRIILPQLTRHRQLSFSVASSRAIPLAKFRELATYTPETWWRNGRGMSPSEQITESEPGDITLEGIDFCWNNVRTVALDEHSGMEHYGVHKEQANRLLEPFAMVKVLVSATEWDNFLNLRLEGGAQSEIREVARGIGEYLLSRTPLCSDWFSWHTPYYADFSYASAGLSFADVSGARCARVSYLNHDGVTDEVKDLELAIRLTRDKHLSPFEHVAVAVPGKHANYNGWLQYRHILYDHSLVDQSWKEKL